MGDWNSNQYLKFERERTQPSLDLISRIRHLDPENILDIGCGPGNSTNALKNAFPNAEILGIDSSDDMLAKARKTYPGISFEKCTVPVGLCDLNKSFDLIFSNACFQWIPEQEELFKNVFESLAPGGTLAVQLPLIQMAPFYKMLNEVLRESKWQCLQGIRDFYNLNDVQYYDILCKYCSDFDIWHTTYYHTVDGADGVLSWYSGSGLRPYLDALDDEKRAEFVAELKENINSLYDVRANGKVILKMPRLFFVGKGKA